jgi:antitoxin component HigA of HigAB toxin-antitoxin module
MEAIKLPLKVAIALDEISALIGRKPEDIALEAVLKHLEDIEDNLACHAAEAEGGPTITLEEYMAQRGISVAELEAVNDEMLFEASERQ